MKTKQKKISIMILNYLRKSPDAGDTLEGITKWWLEMERIEISAKEVIDALESLIQKGKIRIYETKSGMTFYKLKKEL